MGCPQRLPHLRTRDGCTATSRVYDDAPFVFHLVDVAWLPYSAGASDELIAAGVLHDTLEKTCATEAELRERFGSQIARLVVALTEDERINDFAQRKAAATWVGRERGSIDTPMRADPGARAAARPKIRAAIRRCRQGRSGPDAAGSGRLSRPETARSLGTPCRVRTCRPSRRLWRLSRTRHRPQCHMRRPLLLEESRTGARTDRALPASYARDRSRARRRTLGDIPGEGASRRSSLR